METKKSGCQCALEASNAVLTPRTVDQYRRRKNISKKRNKQLSPRRIAYLPKLGANLVTALAGLDVDNFTALCGARVREKKSARCIPSARVFEVRM